MIKINIIYDTRRPDRAGMSPVAIYVSSFREVRYIPTGIKLDPKSWDSKKKEVSPSYPNSRALNIVIRDRLNKAEKLAMCLELQDQHPSAQEFVDMFLKAENLSPAPDASKPKKTHKAGAADWFRRFMETKDGRTKELYEVTLRRLNQFCAQFESLPLEKITVSWLHEWDSFMSKTAPSPNARSIHHRNLRAVFNFAINAEATTHYPYRQYKIQKQKTRKRSLKLPALREIMKCDVPEWMRRYADFWRLSFLLIGINTIDLLQAKTTDLVDGRLEYRRSKTKRLYSIKVEPEALDIINRYRGKKHLLCWLDEICQYRSFQKMCNDALSKIGASNENKSASGKRAYDGIFPGLTLYWARHSWATTAASLDIPKETIAHALGHGSDSVTDIYIDFDQEKVDAANRAVIDWVLYGQEPPTRLL